MNPFKESPLNATLAGITQVHTTRRAKNLIKSSSGQKICSICKSKKNKKHKTRRCTRNHETCTMNKERGETQEHLKRLDTDMPHNHTENEVQSEEWDKLMSLDAALTVKQEEDLVSIYRGLGATFQIPQVDGNYTTDSDSDSDFHY